MKKKTRRRVLWGVWLLVLVAGASLWFVPPKTSIPRKIWRVPVTSSLTSLMPSAPTLPVLQIPPILAAPQTEVKEQQESDVVSEDQGPYEENIRGVDAPMQTPESAPTPNKMLPPPASGKGWVALVIDDMGLVPALSSRALQLPAKVTLSYLPYAPRVQSQVDQARARGHEIMLHLPMEPLGSQKAGPGALTTSMAPDEIRERAYKALESFAGYEGVNNHMGSKFTMDRRGMGVVADVMHERGVYFLDSRTSPKSVAATIMRETGVATASRDVFLDDDLSPQAIWGQLERLEVLAKRQGGAIAIGHPHAVTLQALERWIPQAEARGIQWVSISQIVK